jgi:hypothetical protein
MSSSVVSSHHNDETEFDFKEYYTREKTLELRDIYIP